MPVRTVEQNQTVQASSTVHALFYGFRVVCDIVWVFCHI